MIMRSIAVGVVAMVLACGCANESGETKKKDLQFDQLPMVVRKGVEVAYPDAHVMKVVEETNRDTGVVQYKVHLADKYGAARDDIFLPDGSKLVTKPDYKAGVPTGIQ